MCPVAKWDSHLHRPLHVSKCIPCELLCRPEQEYPQCVRLCVRLDMHQSLPGFALLTRINKRRHAEISNFVHRQVSKLAKVNENLLVVLSRALFEVKMHHTNYFQQKWVLGGIQSQLQPQRPFWSRVTAESLTLKQGWEKENEKETRLLPLRS